MTEHHAIPGWVLSSGFVLLGIWELYAWSIDQRIFQLFLSISWVALGVIHFLRFEAIRRRQNYLARVSGALEERITQLEK